ncbi:MAG: hypothetical protein F6K22_36440 [Okeania sp. SIO2F4]|uniref:hypothetical protein n=1 Tax=Okeania sp. SIO2F4 TaxID=2607790 RepID=UPI00142A6753|nr:hypothetical protein [Okeania sp. SIO2F4]NES07801.1 hypothetical protein [Okeania sp. SIO2F4]
MSRIVKNFLEAYLLLNNWVLLKLVYDINLNYLAVSPQESGGKKEEERGIEGDALYISGMNCMLGQKRSMKY